MGCFFVIVFFLLAWAEKRGYKTAKAARNDVYRAANSILRLAAEGRLRLCLRPPGYAAQKGEPPLPPSPSPLLPPRGPGSFLGWDGGGGGVFQMSESPYYAPHPPQIYGSSTLRRQRWRHCRSKGTRVSGALPPRGRGRHRRTRRRVRVVRRWSLGRPRPLPAPPPTLLLCWERMSVSSVPWGWSQGEVQPHIVTLIPYIE